MPAYGRSLNNAGVKEQVAKLGMEVVGITPVQFAAYMKEENARWSQVVRDLNLKAE